MSDSEQNTSKSDDIADLSSKTQEENIGNGCDDDVINEIEKGLDGIWGNIGMQEKYDGMIYSQ